MPSTTLSRYITGISGASTCSRKQMCIRDSPTVSRELSLQPGTIPPYTAYTIQSDAEGYYSVRNLNVTVYGGITAVQPVEMIPLPEQVTSGMLEFPETGPQDLD